MIPCVYKYLFDVECLGCGFQRSILSVIHLEFVNSFYFFPGLLPFTIFIVVEFVRVIGIKRNELRFYSRFFGFSSLGIQVITYILRFYGIIPWTCDI